jgi:hypothetical protein
MRSEEFLEGEMRRPGLLEINLRHARTLPQFFGAAYTPVRWKRCQ